MMEESTKYRILVVDDEEVIRTMLMDFFEDTYDVFCAQDGEAALDMLRRIGTDRQFDMVISDINMPGMRGYELLAAVKREYPQIKTLLITAYNVDDYVRLAKNHGICNIIAKTTPFNFQEMQAVVDGLLTGNIFGLKRYLQREHTIVNTFVIRSSDDAKRIREEVVELFQEKFGNVGELKLVLDELITNAIYHAPRGADGQEKYREFSDVTLGESEYIYVTCGYDREKYGVAILDMQGTLKKDTILYRIDRHIHAEGILDDSGRGVHMSRIFADRLIVNIDPGHKTEMVLFNYIDKTYKGYKPLYINEL